MDLTLLLFIICRDIDNDQEAYDDIASFEKDGENLTHFKLSRQTFFSCFQYGNK